MPPPRLLLIGCNGQVGWELCRTLAPLAEVDAVDFPDIDLTQPHSIRAHVDRVQPGIIVNAAAYTAVDKAEEEPDLAQKINGDAPGVLAEQAKHHGALLVHYSTDYVFDGTKTTPYVETDTPNPLGVYGRTKLAGDRAIEAVGCDHLIFRLCWVYGARGQNFMRTMQRLAAERETLRVVNDQFGSPTWSRMIAETTAQALGQWLHRTEGSSGAPEMDRPSEDQLGREDAASISPPYEQGEPPLPVPLPPRGGEGGPADAGAGEGAPQGSGGQRDSSVEKHREKEEQLGLYHLAASGSTSWHGFAEAIIEATPAEHDQRKCTKVEGIPSSEYPTPAKRPACSVLDCTKLHRTFRLKLPDWRASLAQVLEQ